MKNVLRLEWFASWRDLNIGCFPLGSMVKFEQESKSRVES